MTALPPKERALALQLLMDLNHFKALKQQRWEQIEDSLQMANKLGTPSEDWIVPPDEKKAERILREDPDYNNLRSSIESLVPQVIEAAGRNGIDLKHKLDWIKFTDPLLGTAALDDAILVLQKF